MLLQRFAWPTGARTVWTSIVLLLRAKALCTVASFLILRIAQSPIVPKFRQEATMDCRLPDPFRSRSPVTGPAAIQSAMDACVTMAGARQAAIPAKPTRATEMKEKKNQINTPVRIPEHSTWTSRSLQAFRALRARLHTLILFGGPLPRLLTHSINSKSNRALDRAEPIACPRPSSIFAEVTRPLSHQP